MMKQQHRVWTSSFLQSEVSLFPLFVPSILLEVGRGIMIFHTLLTKQNEYRFLLNHIHALQLVPAIIYKS